MAMLGRCLAFHLKYPAEMARLYWTEEPDHEGLQDAERVLRMIRVVGDTACREAADFLSACAERLEPYLANVGTFKKVRRNLEYIWELKYKQIVEHHRKHGLLLGVWINEELPAIVPVHSYVSAAGADSYHEAT